MNLGESLGDPILDDFRNFLFLVWKHLRLPEPTPVQYDIAHYLQHGPDRAIIEGYRGVGKSWITSAFVVWVLLRDPQMKIMVVSASKERADAFSIFTRRLIGDMPILRHLEPRRGQRDSQISFDVGPAQPDHSPSVKSVGITGQITGSRADLIVPDDIETPKNSLTQLQRERLGELVKEFDAVLKPGGMIRYLGTPQCEMSLYNELRERGYDCRIWPARYPEAAKIVGYRGALAPIIRDAVESGDKRSLEPVDPGRFSHEDLTIREASYGRSGFALQFMLDTSMSDAERYPLKLSDLITTDFSSDQGPTSLAWANGAQNVLQDVQSVGLAGDRVVGPAFVGDQWLPWSGVCMSIDPSGKGADELGYAVVAHLAGRMFLLASGGLRGGYDEKNLVYLAQLAKTYGVHDILVETNFGDGMFEELLKPVLRKVHPARIESIRSVGQKEARIIDTLEPVMNQHRLVVSRDVMMKDQKADPTYQLFYQMTRLTRERGCLKHDDRLDALSIAVSYWVRMAAQDPEDILEELKREALEAELQRFEEGAGVSFGYPGSMGNWTDNYRSS